MTDRELLELAAKAAGLTIAKWADGRYMHLGPVAIIAQEDGGTYGWRPLTDDGDALRLAVKLGIDLTFNELAVMAWPTNGADGEGEPYQVDDPYANARLVIVRAAAEIGRSNVSN